MNPSVETILRTWEAEDLISLLKDLAKDNRTNELIEQLVLQPATEAGYDKLAGGWVG